MWKEGKVHVAWSAILIRDSQPTSSGPVASHTTSQGTRRYAARFSPTAAPRYFREPVGCGTPDEPAPLVSSLGIGSYLGSPDAATDQAYTAAMVAAVEGGINVLDTAINYRFQRSERAVGAALAMLARRGFAREEIFVCTKGGYLTTDGHMPANPAAYFQQDYIRPGILRAEDIAVGCHAMSPGFLANQLERSLANLGVDCVDVYYIHNPETQLGAVSRPVFQERLRAAFEFLESAAAAGKIRFYGVATWNGFRQPVNARDYLSLAETEQLARDVAGGAHRFRFLQLPFNLGMTDAITRANQPVHGPAVTLTEAAEALGVSLVASASLQQGQMAENLPAFISEALELASDAERAIQFVRSSPGILTALVGMSRVEHVRANLELVSKPLATAEQFSRLFDRGRKS
jgi:aryl-alcohol dehydrogenase-like predicted oxidoreductase